MYSLRVFNLLKLSFLTSRLPLWGVFFILFSFFAQNTFAEGSKDLYPAGAQGNRAFLYANIDGTNSTLSYPFKTRGTHYVYVKAGEKIAVSSSAIGVNNGQIILTAPNGNIISYNGSDGLGYIPNRTAELQGPEVGYSPIVISVSTALAGVWKVEFLAPVGNGSSSDVTAPNIFANANWTQSTAANANFIAAWDVSVKNTANTGWLNGRVYTNVLNLGINNNFTSSQRGFYVNNYILTEDGRAYRVQTNGNNGWAFTFFSNNNGFAVNGVPTYKSLNSSSAAALSALHDPRTLDDALNKTHKIFYNKPNADLPETETAFITAANQTTWLKKNAVLPIITDLKFIGIEGTESKLSYKGAKITFTSSSSGSYQITIPLVNGADRIINGSAVPGYNEIFWDVKDGNGNFVQPGPISPLVQTFLRSAEVHFPYLDMEINPQGIIIELIENNTNYDVNPLNNNPSEYSDKVYWDDINISNAGNAGRYSSDPVTNLSGISSNSNGHKFGRYNDNANDHFGDQRSMDTWTYIESGKTTQLVNIEIREADLKIESINPDLTKYFSDQMITYTVKVKNDGPSATNGAKFTFSIPTGLTINSVISANQTTGVVINNPITGVQNYNAILDLPNQATIDFIIVTTFTGTYNQVFDNAKASILRPADLSDPDATGNNAAGPVDADEECLNGALSGVGLCNNIKYNTINGQDVCIGSNIATITYPLSPDGTQFETLALPTALSLQDVAGNRTISGSLSAAGIHTFYIKTLNTNRTQTNAIIRANTLADATANGPLSICEDATDNPVVNFIGTGGSGAYEFSYSINNASVQTVSTVSGLATASVAISLNNTGAFIYKLTSVKDLSTGCSQAKNISVTVNIQPKPIKAHIQLNN
ncbi:DUF11 domain-containing protein [Pedobacter cryotolerans]|uniref:DUF11 domain-containing protein n=1 Tax=Pedobacter cryotolerans TaxID=2571270 RepID=A0A4U1C044_9SPHI|nr:DUF11 domain-containing protein [Pedobacter cryotolerans]TKB97159.1 hypothetical protein FA045_17390 [Pedobacter cryotolerans]